MQGSAAAGNARAGDAIRRDTEGYQVTMKERKEERGREARAKCSPCEEV